MNSIILFTISLIGVCLLNPKTDKQALIKSSLIPFVVIILITLIIALFKSVYDAVLNLPRALIPGVISGILLYLSLKKKVENDNKASFPFMILFVLVISIVYILFMGYLNSVIRSSLGF